ncbi:tellurium resistance protein TerC [Yersinia phage vB_YenM_P778]
MLFGLSHDMLLALVLSVMLIASLSVDFIFHKGDDMKSATIWSVFWVGCGILVGGFVYLIFGADGASQYFAGYALEKALSMDNLIVFMAIFSYFGINDQKRQHKILLWGIAGAIVFRGIFVAFGATLFNLQHTLNIAGMEVQVHSLVNIAFGLIVGYSAYAMLAKNEADGEVEDYNNKWFNRLARKWFPRAGVMVMCGITIELSDVMFSFDSVPTVIAVTKEPMIVYAAMLSAILGLRALFFVIQSLVEKLWLLEKFVVAILFFVAAKLIAEPFGVHISPLVSVTIVLGLIGAGVITSLLIKPKN